MFILNNFNPSNSLTNIKKTIEFSKSKFDFDEEIKVISQQSQHIWLSLQPYQRTLDNLKQNYSTTLRIMELNKDNISFENSAKLSSIILQLILESAEAEVDLEKHYRSALALQSFIIIILN